MDGEQELTPEIINSNQSEDENMDMRIEYEDENAANEKVFPHFDEEFRFGYPKAWPAYEAVDLDRKIPVKLKKLDFDPPLNPLIGNISHSNGKLFVVGKPERKAESKMLHEIGMFLPYLIQYGEGSIDLFKSISERLIDDSLDDNSLSLDKLRELYPIVPFLNLSLIFDLLALQFEVDTQGALPRFENNQIQKEVNYLSEFICQECHTDCFEARYYSKEENCLICINCFESGHFSSYLSSINFEFHVTTPIEPITMEWSDNDILRLLTSMELHDADWNKIGLEIGKDPIECQIAFVTMKIPKWNVRSLPTDLQSLIGSSSNPVMTLIDILMEGGLPILAAEAAKTSMTTLLSTQSFSKDILWETSLLAFRDVIEFAQTVKQKEAECILIYLKELVISETELLEKKVEYIALLDTRLKEFSHFHQ
jgi:hypothetical protein